MQGTDLKTGAALKEISEASSLSAREKHLIGLAVTLTRGCDFCTKGRFQGALKDGITQQELIDLTDLVAMTNAGVVIRTALLAVEEEKEEVCTDDVCKTH